jgi:hypothetical protein
MKRKTIAELGYVVFAVLLAGNVHSQTVNLELTSPPAGGYFAATDSGLFVATLNGYDNPNTHNDQIIAGNDLIGIYQFSASQPNGLSIGTPFYATCISPAGVLNWNTPYTYSEVSFNGAGNGLNPSGFWAGWATGSANGGYGIQNANWLYTHLSTGIINDSLAESGHVGNSTDDAQGAAMALAMYTALYDSAGIGQVSSTIAFNGSGKFQITGGLNLLNPALNNVYSDYLQDLKMLDTSLPFSAVPGDVLVPSDTSGQDMILIGGSPQGGIVPEPTTIISGALLLLPFGASTLRVLRRSRAA